MSAPSNHGGRGDDIVDQSSDGKSLDH